MRTPEKLIAQTISRAGAARRLGCTLWAISRAVSLGKLASYPDADGEPRLLIADVDAYGEGRTFGVVGGDRRPTSAR